MGINMGSETIPPCKENIIHITLDRPVYYFNKKALSFIPSISGIVPNSYKKYTLTKGSKNKKKKNYKLKIKTVVRMVNGEPVTKKIKVKGKKTLSKKMLGKKGKRGFGKGFKNGKKKKSNKCKV